MSQPFDLDCETFTTGTVGLPGARVFYLQGGAEGRYVTLRCEKQQVGALADYFTRILVNQGAVPGAASPELIELEADFVVGALSLGFDPERSVIQLEVHELMEDDDEIGAQARWNISVAHAAAFVTRAEYLMKGGRPPCRLCGRPIDPEGHTCVKTNGHLPH